MVFVLVFSALAVSLASLTGTNVQIASNQHRVKTALYAAQSGLDCAKFIVSTVNLGQTSMNTVTDAEANVAWTNLCTHVQSEALDGKTVPSPTRFTDAVGDGDQLVTPALDFGSANVDFSVRFYRYDSDPRTIKLQASGANSATTRKVAVEMAITKDREVLTYAIASRGRMWLTGDTTIHGDLYSSWDRPSISPFNMSEDSSVLGTINTVLELDDILDEGYQMETLDGSDNPLFTFDGTVYDIDGDPLSDTVGTVDSDAYLTDTAGNPVYDADGQRITVDFNQRVYSSGDEVHAYHEGMNYDQPTGTDVPGMDIGDYNTDCYNSGLTEITSCPTADRAVEYFPHASGDYTYPRDGTPSYTSNQRLTRHVYENQTFTNTRLPEGRQALFKNCTFEEVLYIDCYKSSTSSQSYTNNVRFQDCTFNGVIVTDVPQPFNWQRNCLYFTGGATFDNQSSIQEATVLAPHFNVNLGNTNPDVGDNNILTGAIVGGIVDVRGNAEIYGTIISMFDTTPYSSGYVTNIGATLEDGGSETTELGDIGTIDITPEEDMMLPSGITSPIIIKPKQDSYCESV
jgi:type IV pilus assembly PilX-like protein